MHSVAVCLAMGTCQGLLISDGCAVRRMYVTNTNKCVLTHLLEMKVSITQSYV